MSWYILFGIICNDEKNRDKSEGKEKFPNKCSKKCIACRYYYYKDNDNDDGSNKSYICFICNFFISQEEENKVFRIISLEKGTFRTVSDCSFTEIQKALENNNVTEKWGRMESIKKLNWYKTE